MQPRIEMLPPKKLVGTYLNMSLSENKTIELWRSFMPQRANIPNKVSSDLFSLQIYPTQHDFSVFNPTAVFAKWAAVEVEHFDNVPQGLHTLDLHGGLYAVFLYRGHPAKGATMFQYIFAQWLPQSTYQLDQRPHFELLGEKYNNNSDSSEEEIWIPIK